MKHVAWRDLIRLSVGCCLPILVLGTLCLALRATAERTASMLPASGQVLWQADGVPVCTADLNQRRPEITSDGVGGAIVVWEDERTGSSTFVYARRVYSDGASAWFANGVQLSTRAGWWPQITTDGAGGAIVSWESNGIYAQRVYSDGTLAWTTNGISICTASGDQWYGAITSDDRGGAIITWEDTRNGTADIYAQRVYSDGTVAWATHGISICAASGDQYTPQITSDGAGGAIVTWYDYRSGSGDIYAQRVYSNGTVAWITDGVSLCMASGNQFFPKIIGDGAGGAIVAWEDFRNGHRDIYAQRVYSDGRIVWATNGVSLCTASGNQRYPALVGDSAGGAIVAWQDGRSSNGDVYVQRVYSDGRVVWAENGIPVIAAGVQSLQWYPDIASDGAGGAIITWQSYDIYSQRVYSDGTLAWGMNGLPVCQAAYDQRRPRIAGNGVGGAIIVWEDNRRWYKTDELDIYVQRVGEVTYRFYLPLVSRNN